MHIHMRTQIQKHTHTHTDVYINLCFMLLTWSIRQGISIKNCKFLTRCICYVIGLPCFQMLGQPQINNGVIVKSGREHYRVKYHRTVDLFGLACFVNKNKNCQLPYSWFQTSQTGGQQYSDTSPIVFPGLVHTWWFRRSQRALPSRNRGKPYPGAPKAPQLEN